MDPFLKTLLHVGICLYGVIIVYIILLSPLKEWVVFSENSFKIETICIERELKQ